VEAAAVRGEAQVLVAGAGPAGSALALRLARAGISVTLLDRARHPRPKPCGECLNPGAVREMEMLGVEHVLDAGCPLEGWRLRATDGAFFDGRFPPPVRGVAIDRSRLDAALAAEAVAAGARMLEERQVVDLLHGGGRVRGVRVRTPSGDTQDMEAAVVVGADGLRSVVARRLGVIRRPPRLRKVALTAHCTGIAPSAAGAGIGELRATAGGCVGVADIGGGVHNVTVVASGDEIARLADDPEGYFDLQRARTLVDRGAGVRAGPLQRTGPFDVPVRRPGAPGALLVGDAAGYYDPFTGQGVYRALRGARIAAAVIGPLLAGDIGWEEALGRYSRAHRQAFRAGRLLQRAIEQVVSRPRAFGATSRLLHCRPAAADALVGVAGDALSPGRLLQPRVLASLLPSPSLRPSA
jgi:menaquinone-9 beta-reductase